MNRPKNPGLLSRVLAVLQRVFLGKSADGYMKQFSGNDEYWDRTIAAGQGWPGDDVVAPNSSAAVSQDGAIPVVAPDKEDVASPIFRMTPAPIDRMAQQHRDDYLTPDPRAKASVDRAIRSREPGKPPSPKLPEAADLPIPLVEKQP
jgi:hypothetical protein